MQRVIIRHLKGTLLVRIISHLKSSGTNTVTQSVSYGGGKNVAALDSKLVNT